MRMQVQGWLHMMHEAVAVQNGSEKSVLSPLLSVGQNHGMGRPSSQQSTCQAVSSNFSCHKVHANRVPSLQTGATCDGEKYRPGQLKDTSSPGTRVVTCCQTKPSAKHKAVGVPGAMMVHSPTQAGKGQCPPHSQEQEYWWLGVETSYPPSPANRVASARGGAQSKSSRQTDRDHLLGRANVEGRRCVH